MSFGHKQLDFMCFKIQQKIPWPITLSHGPSPHQWLHDVSRGVLADGRWIGMLSKNYLMEQKNQVIIWKEHQLDMIINVYKIV